MATNSKNSRRKKSSEVPVSDIELVPDSTPSAVDAPKEPSTQSSAADFEQIVNESKEAVHASEQVAPKKRGRPAGWRKNPETPTQTPVTQAVPGTPPPDVSQLLVPPMQALSQIPARKHGIPELALTRDEALACAQSLNAVLNAFIPDIEKMSPKTAAIFTCAITFGSVGFSKYQIYLEKRPPTFEKEQAKASEVDSNPPIRPSLDAMEHFRQ